MDIRRLTGFEAEPQAKPFPAPVFVIGAMRSGTTFLVEKLAQHPQLLRIGSELRSVWTELGGAPCEGLHCDYRDLTHVNSTAVANMTYYFTNFINLSKGWQRHLMRTRNAWGKKMGRVMYDWEHIRPLHKSTHLVNKIAYVHGLYPNAKTLFIIRDIESQSASLKRHIENDNKKTGRVMVKPHDERGCWVHIRQETAHEKFASDDIYPGNFSVIPEMWVRLNYLAMRSINALPESSVKVIHYESLVRNQAPVLQDVLAFLGLEDKHQNVARRIAGAKMPIINTTTTGDVLTKWKSQLSDAEIADIETVKRQYDKECAEIDDFINSHVAG